MGLYNVTSRYTPAINIGFTAVLIVIFCIGDVITNFGFGISCVQALAGIPDLFETAKFLPGKILFVNILILVIILDVVLNIVRAVYAIVKRKPLGNIPLYICAAYFAIFITTVILTGSISSFGLTGGWLPMLIAAVWIWVVSVQKKQSGEKESEPTKTTL